jgi:hypothetical protein
LGLIELNEHLAFPQLDGGKVGDEKPIIRRRLTFLFHTIQKKHAQSRPLNPGSWSERELEVYLRERQLDAYFSVFESEVDLVGTNLSSPEPVIQFADGELGVQGPRYERTNERPHKPLDGGGVDQEKE